jgi:hypothetical protein
MYRTEWECCGDVTETEGYEPTSCPFCTPNVDIKRITQQAKREVLLEAAEAMESGAFETPYGLRRMAEEILK